MDSHLKPKNKQPFVLELSNLEKVVCELEGEQPCTNVNNTKSNQKIGKKEYKNCSVDSYLPDGISEYGAATTVSNFEERCKSEFSEYVERNDDIKPLYQKVSFNSPEMAKRTGTEKTGLEKLIPYHLIKCINPDMLIRINDIEFGVHRPLLKLYTTYFEEAITEMDECIVILPESKVKIDIFQVIYFWMLHDSDEALNFVNRTNIASIYVAAKFLKIDELVKTCRMILDSKELFNEITAFSLFMEAFNLDDCEMQLIMLPRIQTVFLHIVSSSLYISLPVEVVLMFLSSDFIKVHSEIEVFYSAIKWLLHDWPHRSYLSYKIMQTVRFALLKPSELIDLKRCPDSPMIKLIINGKDILKLIDDGIALSVKLETHGCSPDLLQEDCNKLGLNLPSPRCYFESDVLHQSYDEFLKLLEIIKKQHHYS